MNEPRVIESVTNECQSLGRAHESSSARAEQLIACLEGEIAKRDEELAACRVAVENCEVFRARIAELEADRDSHQRCAIQAMAELAAIKAQDTVGEVVGWYRLDRPYEMTPYPSVCATWHRLGAPVAPLYAAQAIIDGLRGENERIRLNIAEYNEAIACYQSERDQQAQRIGELEGLLRHAQKQVPTGSGLHMRIDAALSAGKEVQ